ncbi:hypothetical protein IV203_012573 [Nitzschia inconspicua]|uniref:Uncharacterized protein n=1 Tax=Nitzschia inconspicua TaxID=303405 RepID=A0A9K3PKE9_9STRA|nr:hypothetical protein IV203_012573 [Nitzschia inconspicua]
MSSLLNQIISNDIVDLKITEEAEDVFGNEDGCVHDFLDALKVNTSIKTARLTEDFLGCLRADARSKVLQALGKDLDLKEVTLGDALILVEDITHIIAKSPSLYSMDLHNIILQGQQEHFQALEATLHQHPNLKEFDLSDNCEPAVEDIDLERIKNAKNASACTGSMPPPLKKSTIATSA